MQSFLILLFSFLLFLPLFHPTDPIGVCVEGTIYYILYIYCLQVLCFYGIPTCVNEQVSASMFSSCAFSWAFLLLLVLVCSDIHVLFYLLLYFLFLYFIIIP